MIASALDLLAIFLLGIVMAGATSVALGGSSTPDFGAFSTLVPASIEGLVVFAAIAGALLVIKSGISLILTRRTYRFLANRSAIVSSQLADRVLSLPLVDLQRRASQSFTQALTGGANAATVNTLGPFSVIMAESSLIVLLMFGLGAVDPIIALFTLTFFGIVAIVLQLALGRWAHRLGRVQTESEIGSMTELQHAIRAYRELVVAHRRQLFVQRFQELRWRSASVLSDTYILGQAGKYVFEVALVLGAGGLVVILATTRSIEAAVLAMTIFLLVATRVFPSLLRLQGAFGQLRNAEGVASELFTIIQDLDALGDRSHRAAERVRDKDTPEPFVPAIELESVSLTYPDTQDAALQGVTLSITPGQSVAIVGSTGAGKSSLADVILGVVVPSHGTVRICGQTPSVAVSTWPGSLAYVPQDVAVLSGTVRENVALGFPEDQIADDLVWEALARAHLSQFLREYRDGLDTVVGEHGVKLSGGQRQRLGIARALYTHPKLLVMDEATSALDAETERDITMTVAELSGDVTTIVIAHRLATVRQCDLVFYLDKGRVEASGTFEEVRSAVPEFDRQAQLLGL